MSEAASHLDRRIGERLRLRDLRIFQTVADCGSMAKAAAALGVSQPAVSQAIAQLEAALKVRLLERGPRGATPTIYGDALRRRATEAFDALGQGIRDIEFLGDPDAGEVIIGASESHIAGGFLAEIIHSLARKHPRMTIRVVEANTAALDFTALRERKVDLMLGRIARDRADIGPAGEFRADILFEEAIHIVTGGQNDWARAASVGFADLVDRPWILAPEGTAVYELVRNAFHAHGLPRPNVTISTYSMNLRLQLLMQGPYLTAFPSSLVRFNSERWNIRALPLSLGDPLPVACITLRERTLSPAVRVFIEHAKKVTEAMRG